MGVQINQELKYTGFLNNQEMRNFLNNELGELLKGMPHKEVGQESVDFQLVCPA